MKTKEAQETFEMEIMKQKKYTQTQQVIDVLHKCGGYATFGNLYHLVDTSSWGKKNKETPNSFLALHNFAHLQTIFAAKM